MAAAYVLMLATTVFSIGKTRLDKTHSSSDDPFMDDDNQSREAIRLLRLLIWLSESGGRPMIPALALVAEEAAAGPLADQTARLQAVSHGEDEDWAGALSGLCYVPPLAVGLLHAAEIHGDLLLALGDLIAIAESSGDPARCWWTTLTAAAHAGWDAGTTATHGATSVLTDPELAAAAGDMLSTLDSPTPKPAAHRLLLPEPLDRLFPLVVQQGNWLACCQQLAQLLDNSARSVASHRCRMLALALSAGMSVPQALALIDAQADGEFPIASAIAAAGAPAGIVSVVNNRADRDGNPVDTLLACATALDEGLFKTRH